MLRTRRPLLALVLLGVLLAGGYLLSAVRSDPEAGGAPAATSATGTGTEAGPTSAVTSAPGTGTASESTSTAPSRTAGSGLTTVAASTLPAEARQTLRLIDRGGPFPYERDGSVFGNVERILPRQPRGWYREFTVPTPGERDRGARRIVAGRDGSRYYTGDHCESFALVDRDR